MRAAIALGGGFGQYETLFKRRKDLVMKHSHALPICLLAALCCLSQMLAAQTPRIEVGQPFPDLVLPRLEDGAPASISDFRGEKLVLHIWASW